MPKYNPQSVDAKVFLARLNVANAVLATAISEVGESVSPEAKEHIHDVLTALYEADRLVRFPDV